MTYNLVLGIQLLASNLTEEQCNAARLVFRNFLIVASNGLPITTNDALQCVLGVVS
jgi:hypothetical protein